MCISTSQSDSPEASGALMTLLSTMDVEVGTVALIVCSDIVLITCLLLLQA